MWTRKIYLKKIKSLDRNYVTGNIWITFEVSEPKEGSTKKSCELGSNISGFAVFYLIILKICEPELHELEICEPGSHFFPNEWTLIHIMD